MDSLHLPQVVFIVNILALGKGVNLVSATSTNRSSTHPTTQTFSQSEPSPLNGTVTVKSTSQYSPGGSIRSSKTDMQTSLKTMYSVTPPEISLSTSNSGFTTSSSSVSNFMSSGTSSPLMMQSSATNLRNPNASVFFSSSSSASLVSSSYPPSFLFSTFPTFVSPPSSVPFNSSSHFTRSTLSTFSSSSTFTLSSPLISSSFSSSFSSHNLSASIYPSPSSSANKSFFVKSPVVSSPSSISISPSYPSSSLNVTEPLMTSSFPSSIATSTSSQTKSPIFPNSSVLSLISSSQSSFMTSSTYQSTLGKAFLSISTTFSTHSFSQTHISRTPYMSLDTTSLRRKSSSSVMSILKLSTSSFMAVETSSRRAIILTAIPNLLEFDGKLIVSVKNPVNQNIYDLKQLSDSIEGLLDNIFEAVPKFTYSKVLQIKRNERGRLECLFKLFIKEPSDETPATLKERLSKYNNTQGFGEFALYSVETSMNDGIKGEDTLELWTIVVIAALGVLCLILAIVLVCQKKRIEKLRTNKDITSPNDANDNKRYQHYSVFDGIDETQNIPLKLTKIPVSPTDSKKPLKIYSSDSEGEDEPSPQQDDEARKDSNQRSNLESDEENYKTSDKEPDEPDKLHINEMAEEDETKFSTFSRKH